MSQTRALQVFFFSTKSPSICLQATPAISGHAVACGQCGTVEAALVARRSIAASEVLSFDYVTTEWSMARSALLPEPGTELAYACVSRPGSAVYVHVCVGAAVCQCVSV